MSDDGPVQSETVQAEAVRSEPVQAEPALSDVSATEQDGGDRRGRGRQRRGGAGGDDRPPPSAVDTLISLAFGFVLAFTFRGYFIEPFVIPTGSMAPTLYGRHVVAGDAKTGEWAVDVRALGRGAGGLSRGKGVEFVHHPVSGLADRLLTEDRVLREDRRVRSGERVLALKHEYAWRSPERFDVVVFGPPTEQGDAGGEGGADAFIKRIVGLPGESIALVDGDVFVADGEAGWSSDAWRVARKPVDVQRALWRRVWEGPIGGNDSPWKVEGGRLVEGGLEAEAGGAGVLRWRTDRPISDRTGYNELYEGIEGRWHGPHPWNPFFEVFFPVGDVAMSGRVVSREGSFSGRVVASVERNGRGWRAVFDEDSTRIEVLRGGVWQVEAEASSLGGLGRRRWDVALWHSDQVVRVLVNGRVVCEHAYEGDVEDRLALAMVPEFLRTVDGVRQEQVHSVRSVLSDPASYALPRVSWEVEGGVDGLVLEGLALDRDVWFRPYHNPGAPDGHRAYPLGGHPDQPATLGAGSYFVVGDNSAASSDSRYWGPASGVVRGKLGDVQTGVLPAELIIGRAAAVYLPSPAPVGDRGRVLPGFDLGRVRWIR